MLTIHNNSYSYDGLSSETKPTDVPNGTIFHEIDTGKDYQFDIDGSQWIEQPAQGGGGSGLELVEHDYTVTYADGTTATLKNAEVV